MTERILLATVLEIEGVLEERPELDSRLETVEAALLVAITEEKTETTDDEACDFPTDKTVEMLAPPVVIEGEGGPDPTLDGPLSMMVLGDGMKDIMAEETNCVKLDGVWLDVLPRTLFEED